MSCHDRKENVMNHHNMKLSHERGPVRVTWVSEGEGYNGKFEPDNPEDTLLLRFYCSIKEEDTALIVAFETRRTCFTADSSLEDKAAALDVLLERFYDAYTNHPEQDISALADELSYISADTYHSLALKSHT